MLKMIHLGMLWSLMVGSLWRCTGTSEPVLIHMPSIFRLTYRLLGDWFVKDKKDIAVAQICDPSTGKWGWYFLENTYGMGVSDHEDCRTLLRNEQSAWHAYLETAQERVKDISDEAFRRIVQEHNDNDSDDVEDGDKLPPMKDSDVSRYPLQRLYVQLAGYACGSILAGYVFPQFRWIAVGIAGVAACRSVDTYCYYEILTERADTPRPIPEPISDSPAYSAMSIGGARQCVIQNIRSLAGLLDIDHAYYISDAWQGNKLAVNYQPKNRQNFHVACENYWEKMARHGDLCATLVPLLLPNGSNDYALSIPEHHPVVRSKQPILQRSNFTRKDYNHSENRLWIYGMGVATIRGVPMSYFVYDAYCALKDPKGYKKLSTRTTNPNYFGVYWQ